MTLFLMPMFVGFGILYDMKSKPGPYKGPMLVQDYEEYLKNKVIIILSK